MSIESATLWAVFLVTVAFLTIWRWREDRAGPRPRRPESQTGVVKTPPAPSLRVSPWLGQATFRWVLNATAESNGNFRMVEARLYRIRRTRTK